MKLYNTKLLISPLLPDGGLEKLIQEVSSHSFFVDIVEQTPDFVIVEFTGGPKAMKKLYTTWKKHSRSLTRSR